MAIFDPHSHADDQEPFTQHIELELRVDFESKRLAGKAKLSLDRPATGSLCLDTGKLEIRAAEDHQGKPVAFALEPGDPIRGPRLRLALSGAEVTIHYQTAPGATALQWLDPAQTADGQSPYVFTQCQSIHARSVFPCQDSPRVRTRFHVKLDVPRALEAVMAAKAVGRTEQGERAIAEFRMEQPIPPYLFAFAVGAIGHQDLGPRSRVYAEKPLLAAAAYEFAGVDAMILAAEGLFGPYDWERFDLLVMPPSFPFGGMENPRLTFLTPTLLAGDRSLVNVLGHELAHSWTGNLITNATMNDFWLNEGFTTYAERRILEVLEGKDEVQLQLVLGLRGLESDIARFKDRPELTRLRTKLDGLDPDEVYSRIPYEKGCFFLLRLEEIVGRPVFDRFLKAYIQTFRFQSIDTTTFLRFLDEALPEARGKIDLAAWIDGPGLPSDAPRPRSALLEKVELAVKACEQGQIPAADSGFSASEWQVFLSLLPRKLPLPVCEALEGRFHFSASKNAEIRIGWLTIAACSGYTAVFPAARTALLSIGRMKYLRPLYLGLLSAGARPLAEATFAEAEKRYHPVAQAVIGTLLKSKTTEEPRT